MATRQVHAKKMEESQSQEPLLGASNEVSIDLKSRNRSHLSHPSRLNYEPIRFLLVLWPQLA
jgi:hypothetical protein